MSSKLAALQLAISLKKDSLDREIQSNEKRLRELSDTSQLYAFTYGELTAQKSFREMLERWST